MRMLEVVNAIQNLVSYNNNDNDVDLKYRFLKITYLSNIGDVDNLDVVN